MIGEIFQYDAGIQFLVEVRDETDTAKNISTATVKQFVFKKPSTNKLTVDCNFYTDGSDGLVYYTTTSTDLDEIGLYRLQIYLEFSSLGKHTDIGNFRVGKNL